MPCLSSSRAAESEASESPRLAHTAPAVTPHLAVCPQRVTHARVSTPTEPVTEIGPESPGLSPGDEWPFRLALSVEECYTTNMDYQHEQHNVHLVVYHIIWCPKRRRKVLVGPIRARLEQIIREVAAEHDWTVIELAIQPDHVHLFIRANPYTLPSDIPRRIKGRSSRDLRDEFPHLRKLPSLWTRSFFLSTAGNVSQEIIQRYIERQSKT